MSHEFKKYDVTREDYEPGSDWTNSIVPPSVPAGVQCLNGIAQGAGDDERYGNIVRLHSIFIRGVLHCAEYIGAGTVGHLPIVRLVLVVDTHSNAVQINGDEVFGDVPGAAWLSTRLMSGASRFKILWDEVHAFDVPLFDSTDGHAIMAPVPFEVYRRLDLIQQYQGSSGGITDLGSNAIYLLAIKDEWSTNFQPSVYFSARTTFSG